MSSGMRLAGMSISVVLAASFASLGQAVEGSRSSIDDLVARSAWGAQPAKEGLIRQVPRRITIHHTGSASPAMASKVAPHLRGIQRFHQDEMGWPDIAYHILIDCWGRCYQGRDLQFRGESATRYDLSDRALVCLLGDFEKEQPGEAQWQALKNILIDLQSRFQIAPGDVTVHSDLAATSCPGKNLMSRLRSGGAPAPASDTTPE